ncbi:MAG TPA: MDR family MFS transporter, partial [Dehalococcoidales bacterium]|nr:MDR family MFS transporter [Dehalococcoidales bacterium]
VSELGGFGQYTWVTTAYMITSAVVVPITGKLTDIYGRRIFYIAGVAIFTLGSIACGFSQNITEIIFFRAFQGIGAGVMMANAFTTIGDLFPPAVRGKYQGLMSSVFALSSIIGPTLGGFITDYFTWHWIFFVNIPLGVAVIFLFIFFFPNIRRDNQKHIIDYTGVTLLVLAVVPLLLAFSWADVEYPWASPQILGMLVFAVIAGVFFVLQELRSPEPIVPVRLFKNRIVSISMVLNFICGFGMFGSTIFIPLFFQGVLGDRATTSGSFLTPMSLGTVFGSFISGQFLSRMGGHYRIQGAVGLAILTGGMFLLSGMGMNTSHGMAVLNIVLAGFGMGIIMPLYIISVQNAVEYKFLGVATSVTAFTRSIGGTVGLSVFGSLMTNHFVGQVMKNMPAVVKSVVPADQLNAIVHNPQALFTPEAQSQLMALFSKAGAQATALYNDVINALRLSMSTAIARVFFFAFFIVLAGFILNFFLKEIPLRTHHTIESEKAGSKVETAAETKE